MENRLEEAYEEDTQELNQEEMHWLNDDDEDIHLTRDEYSQSINSLDYYHEDHNLYGLTPSQCEWMVDIIMDEIQHKYDLRPRTRNCGSNGDAPPKKMNYTRNTPETTTVPQMAVSPIPPRPQNTSQASRTQT